MPHDAKRAKVEEEPTAPEWLTDERIDPRIGAALKMAPPQLWHDILACAEDVAPNREAQVAALKKLWSTAEPLVNTPTGLWGVPVGKCEHWEETITRIRRYSARL